MLIGEVARRSGVSARMLRHYDRLGLVQPTGRTVGGYREYVPEDIRRIFYVEGLRSLGLSLRQIARTLDDPGFTPSVLVSDLIRQAEERLDRERKLLERLRTVDAAEPAGWQDVASVVNLLHGLGSQSAARRQRAVLATAERASVPAELLARAILAESDPNVAGALRWALARASASGSAVGVLATAMASDDLSIRRRAVMALAELPDAEATALLTDALGDADPLLRGHAAVAVGARGVTKAVPTLLGMVVEGPNDVEAAELLGTFARDATWGERIMNALVNELAVHAANSAVRIRLTQALAEMPGTIALATLRDLANDVDERVARLASAIAKMIEDRIDHRP